MKLSDEEVHALKIEQVARALRNILGRYKDQTVSHMAQTDCANKLFNLQGRLALVMELESLVLQPTVQR